MASPFTGQAIDVRLLRQTAEAWSETDRVLQTWELGIETNTKLAKFGNGSDGWTDLPYFNPAGAPTVFSITQFGAKVDGVTDDSAAVSAAIDAAVNAGGGTIFFPSGTTLVTAGMAQKTVPTNIFGTYIFAGVGSDSKIKVTSSVSPPIFLTNPGKVVFRDLAIVGTTTQTVEGTVILIQGSDTLFENVLFLGLASTSAIFGVIYASGKLTIRNCIVGGCANTAGAVFPLALCSRFICDSVSVVDYYYLDGVGYNKSGLGYQTQNWIAGTLGTLTGGVLPTAIISNCDFDENPSVYSIDITGTANSNIRLDNCTFNTPINAGPSCRFTTFKTAEISDSFFAYNLSTNTPITCTNVAETNVRNVVYADGATNLTLTGTCKRLNVQNCTAITIVNTASAFVVADQAMPVTASATALAPLGATTHVTGTATITSVTTTNLRAGDTLSLIFDSTAQISDGNNLVLAGNFTGGANRSLTLKYDGTNLYEQARSAN